MTSSPRVGDVGVMFLDHLTAAICQVTDHRWLPYKSQGRPDPLMRWAERRFCNRCEANELRFKTAKDGPLNGEVLVVSAGDVRRLSPDWLEGLYRARWGDYPRQRVTVGGAFPDAWRWHE